MHPDKKPKKYGFKIGDKVFHIVNDEIQWDIIEVIFKDTWGDTRVGFEIPSENILTTHNGYFIHNHSTKEADRVFKTKELLIESLKKQQIHE